MLSWNLQPETVPAGVSVSIPLEAGSSVGAVTWPRKGRQNAVVLRQRVDSYGCNPIGCLHLAAISPCRFLPVAVGSLDNDFRNKKHDPYVLHQASVTLIYHPSNIQES